MRRSVIRVPRPQYQFRFGTVLALAGLLLQLLLPGTMALAGTADPLASAPICTTGAHHSAGHEEGHKALHAACPLCQGQTVVWGFLPPDMGGIAGPRRATAITWSADVPTATPTALAGLRARGPPGEA